MYSCKTAQDPIDTFSLFWKNGNGEWKNMFYVKLVLHSLRISSITSMDFHDHFVLPFPGHMLSLRRSISSDDYKAEAVPE